MEGRRRRRRRVTGFEIKSNNPNLKGGEKKYIMVVWYIWSSNPRITNPIKVLRAELVGWPKNDESFTF